MSASQYIIHELYDPEDTRYWRLHWFEQLTMNQKTREPLLEALFVPLMRTGLDIDSNPRALLDNKSYSFDEAKKIEVGGGQLPMLHIGLLLHQGSPVKRPRYQRKVFKLLIERHSTEVLAVKSGHRPQPRARKIYDIPYKQYELGGTSDYVRCLHIRVPEGRSDGITKVIIPCAELIRFHYGNSSELFHEILTNGLAGDPNRVFNPDKTVLPGGTEAAFVQLSAYVKREDAPIVARYAFAHRALNQGRRIYISAGYNATHPYPGERNHPEPQGRLPEVSLPYENVETRLVVCGKEIVSGGRKHFLVYYIESDSAPFPFQYFEYKQDGDEVIYSVTDETLPDIGRGVSVDDKGGQIITVNDEIEEIFIRTDKEPSPAKEQVEELMWENKFPDLKKKKWRRRDEGGSRKRPPQREPSFVQGHDMTAEKSTAPPGETDTKVGPLSFVYDFDSDDDSEVTREATGTEEVPPDEPPGEKTPEVRPRRTTFHGKAMRASYEMFEQLVNLLGRIYPEKLSCEIVQVPKSREMVRPARSLSEFPTEWEGTPIDWTIVTRDGETRPRRLIAARGICLGEHYFYLLEIEPPERDEEKEPEARRQGKKPPKPRTYTMLLVHYNRRRGFAEMTADDLRKVLVTCAWNGGSWLKPGQLDQFGWYKFKHASRLERAFVARIIRYLSGSGLMPLEKAEAAELRRRLNEIKINEPAQSDERSQGGEQAQAGDVPAGAEASGEEVSPRTSGTDEVPQIESVEADESSERDELPAGGEASESGEPSGDGGSSA
ncbi:MAG TPA: hypothetical protein VF703_07360 [Pyrinomonadaceae bacterium]|jgi:hypothetical protein